MQISIRIHYAGGRAETRPLAPGRYVIGRTAGDLALGDPKVSSTHGELIVTDQGGVTYRDLGSTNGSYLPTGERVTGPLGLTIGQALNIGNCKLFIVATAAGTEVMPAVAPPNAPGAPAGFAAQPPPFAAQPAPFAAQGAAPPFAAQPAPFAAQPATAQGAPFAAQPAAAQPPPFAAQPAAAQPAAAQPAPFAAQPAAAQPAPFAAQPAPLAAAPLAVNLQAPAAAAPPSHHAPVSSAPGSSPYSHPGAPIRHSYPLHIKDASISTAMGLMMKTAPFLLARFGILAAITVGTVLWAVLGLGGMSYFFSKRLNILGYGWMGIFGTVGGWIWWTVVRYFLYLLKAAHIAVLTELITTGQVNAGTEGMFRYGIRVVKDRFGEVNALFALDLLIAGVVGAFNRTLNWVASLIPIPGLDSVVQVVNAIVHASTTYIDETLFSYNLARGDENPFRSSRDGLIYYAQNAKEVLKTGIWVVVLDKVLTVVIWIVMLTPAFLMGIALPSSLWWISTSMLLFALLFTRDLRAAVLKPLFLTMVMIKFHTSVQEQAINEEWDGRLERASGKFRQLKDRATEWVAPSPKPAGAVVAT